MIDINFIATHLLLASKERDAYATDEVILYFWQKQWLIDWFKLQQYFIWYSSFAANIMNLIFNAHF